MDKRARCAPLGADTPAADDEVMDGFPSPVAHGARSFHPGWLAAIARIGTGGHDRYLDGVRLLFAHLTDSFGLKYPGAHTGWGLLARVAAKVAAYNLGIVLHQLLGCPDFAFGRLIV